MYFVVTVCTRGMANTQETLAKATGGGTHGRYCTMVSRAGLMVMDLVHESVL